jgi:phospholipid transport system substrate-binding protein
MQDMISYTLKRTALMLLVALPAGLTMIDAAGATAPSPRELIMETSGKFLVRLQQQRQLIKNDPATAYQLANEIIIPHVDFDRISRWVLGKYWRQANTQQRRQFAEEFTTLLTHTYVTAMVQYVDTILANGDNIEYPPLQLRPEATEATVKTLIRMTEGRVPVNFALHRTGGHWKIYDVTIDGISLATTYRGSFASQIRRTGLDDLIAAMHKKNTGHPGKEIIKASAAQ